MIKCKLIFYWLLKRFTLALLMKTTIFTAFPLPLPFNEYSYILARNILKSIDQDISSSSLLSSAWLSEKENVVNIYFEKLKADEFKIADSSSSTTSKKFYPSRPIESELEQIQASSLYKQLKLLPKGGNLHMHESQMLDRTKFLKMIANSEEYDLLFICDKDNADFCRQNKSLCQCKDYYLTYIKNITLTNPDGWIKVKDSNWTIEKIVNKTTLIGILNEREVKIFPTDSTARWV